MTDDLEKLTRARAWISRHWATVFLVGVLLVIAGAKLRLIHYFGSEVPMADQWAGEGDAVLRPYVHGELTFSQLLAPHNEHRIMFTRVWGLAVFILTGQWDARVGQAVNVILPVLALLVLLSALRRVLTGLVLVAAGLLAAILFSCVSSWENTLNGFQSQFYFLLLFCLLHTVLTFTAQPYSARWWGALAAGFCAQFSMGGGVLSPLTVLFVLLYERFRSREIRPDFFAAAGANLGLLLIGALSLVLAPHHDAGGAGNVWDKLVALNRVLSWPLADVGAAWLYAPSVVFVAWRILRPPTGRNEILVFALVVLSLAQVVAIAWMRGGVASRYLDLMSLGLVMTFVCWALLPGPGKWGQARLVAATAWLVLTGMAICRRDDTSYGVLHARAEQERVRVTAIRAFVESGDVRVLERDEVRSDVDVPFLAKLLSDSALADRLPPIVRKSTPLRPAKESRADFTAADVPGLADGFRPPHPIGSWAGRTARDRQYWSEPITMDAAFVGLWIAGQLQPPHSLIELRTTAGEVVKPLQERVNATERWKRIHFPNPGAPFRIHAQNTSENAWLAFSEPVVVTRASWLASQVLKTWPALLYSGVLAMIFGALGAAWIWAKS